MVIKIVKFRLEQHAIDDLMMSKPENHYCQHRYYQPYSKKDL
jgi:hypothetical protein